MNRGIYLVFISNDEISDKVFWNESYEIFQFLKNCFLKIEWEYDFSINSFSNNIVPSQILDVLINQIECELEDLIRIYQTKNIDGFNFVEEIYNGVDYKLYYRSSELHNQISSLIRIHRRFVNAVNKSESIQIIGNANINKEMLNEIMEIKKADGISKLNNGHLEVKTLNQLTKEGCLVLDGKNYKLTLKGTIIDIAEN